MKKRSIKNLNLNKRSIASVNEISSIKGGEISEDVSCYSPCGGTNATTGCWPNPIGTIICTEQTWGRDTCDCIFLLDEEYEME